MAVQRKYSSVEYILRALVPYSEQNLKLAIRPRQFFYVLERASKRNKKTLQSAMSKAISKGLVKRVDGIPVLTEKGWQKIKPFTPKKLKKDVYLMVAFDIPETIRFKRRQLRTFLSLHDFEQAQKSLWISRLDYRQELKMLIEELELDEFVNIYESAKI